MNGRNGVRLGVLLAALLIASTWHELASPPESRPVADAPIAQAVLPATTLAPTVGPRPAPARPEVAQPRRERKHAHRKHRHHRREVRRRAARQPTYLSRPGGGRDIGWPQCPRNVGFGGRNGLGQPMPDPHVKFVVVGLTNGRSFTPNPCLALHLRWVRIHHVHAAAYAFATYPTRKQLRRFGHRGPYNGHRLLGALGNAGHATARYNIRLMRRHGFVTPHVWLDVEPSSSRPWSGRRTRNSAVVKGWVRAYRGAGYTVGFYSTSSLWRGIVGGLRLHLPEWRTAGPASPRAALQKCHERSFQGGPAVIAQWWTTHRDFDRLCPGGSRARTLSRYFHRW